MSNNPTQTQPVNSGSQNRSQKNISTDDYSNPRKFGKNLRCANIPPGAEQIKKTTTMASFVNTDKIGNDWRVKISVPTLSTFRSSPLLSPLANTDYNVVFPITPQITLSTNANYDSLDPVHSNYAFPQYVNSRTEDINIAGEFQVQTRSDGEYWLAVTHFFRSVTKMFYGETSNKGAPPPIVKLNGYGDFVLNNVPVVITNFVVTLENSIDYIEVPKPMPQSGVFASEYQMVPTNSTISIVCKPIYSRRKVQQFSLDRFINGDLSSQGYI